MSGPIEYSIAFRAIRLAMIRVRLEQERQRRQAATRVRLERARQAAVIRVAALQATRQARVEDALRQERESANKVLADHAVGSKHQHEEKATATRRNAEDEQFHKDLRAAREDLSVVKIDAETEVAANLGKALERAAKANGTVRAEHFESFRTLLAAEKQQQNQRAAELRETIEEISRYRSELSNHESVMQFRSIEALEWGARADQLAKEYAEGSSARTALAAARGLVASAKSLIDEADDFQAKSETRNLLLRDVIDSMKAIGFYVEDPAYERPDRPDGPVIVRATRGGQQMTAKVDLSESIHSVWDGFEGDHCKSAFFDYVAKLGERDLEVVSTSVTPEPILKQLGAKDLPKGGKQMGGA